MAYELKVDTIKHTNNTSAITLDTSGNVTLASELKVNTIKHSNGTSAITINSDGSLSGKFEGAVKFVSTGKASGNPTDTNKVWIAFGITSSYITSNSAGKFGIAGFGQPVGILTYNTSSSVWNSWTYINSATGDASGYGQLSDSSSTPGGNFYSQHGFTYTIEMDKV